MDAAEADRHVVGLQQQGVAHGDLQQGGDLLIAESFNAQQDGAANTDALERACDGRLRLLYVALTRATQRLAVVHAEPLPSMLLD